ncbi:MAG TPA: hypothetical protein VFX16_28475 [Pseudonocardiaceae bacterium]|nr:hypothetical protein [Pseudonocardiaceae bacterium]
MVDEPGGLVDHDRPAPAGRTGEGHHARSAHSRLIGNDESITGVRFGIVRNRSNSPSLATHGQTINIPPKGEGRCSTTLSMDADYDRGKTENGQL